MSEPTKLDFTGQVDRIRQNARPVDTAAYARETDEQRQERLERRMAGKRARWAARLPKLYESATIDSLDDTQNAEQLLAWLEGRSMTLFLAGSVGTGKTFASYALCAEAVGRLMWVEAWNVTELLDALLPGAESAVTWASVFECDLLLLDDLGAPKVTDWAAQTLYRIADKRVSEERRQIVTTNGSYDELVTMWGSPTIDRLSFRSTSMVLKGESRRKAQW